MIYLYCIVEAGTAAADLLATGDLRGLEPNEPLFSIESEGLVAAVSRVPETIFAEEPLNTLLADLPRLAPFAIRHEEAVRALLPAAPALVPLAFGTVFHAPQGVTALLRERADEFRRLLDTLRHKQEWGLKVFRDAAQALEAADTASAELRRLAAAAAAASPGRAHLLHKRREQLRETEAHRLVAQSLDTVLQRLAATSDAVRCDEVPRSELRAPSSSARDPERGTWNPQLVLKAAFLVRAAAVDTFCTVAAELERAYAPQGLSLEVSGPWAPYSFVTLENDGCAA